VACGSSGRLRCACADRLPAPRDPPWLLDLDTAAIRNGRPRALTQAISQWVNTFSDPDGEPVAGIEFESRHGDGLVLWGAVRASR